MGWKLKKKYPKDWFVADHDIIIVDDEQIVEQGKPVKKIKPINRVDSKLVSKSKDIDDFKLTFKSIKKKKTKFPITEYNEYIWQQIKLVSKQNTVDDVRRLFAKASKHYSRYPDYENAILQEQIKPQYYYGAPILSWTDDLVICKQKCIELLNCSLAK